MSLWQTLSGMMRAVLMMSVSGSAVALILFAIKPLIKNRIPKAAQYYMWLFVIAAFLIPFSAFITLPISTPLAPVQRVIEENVKSNIEWQEQLSHEIYGMSYAELEDLEKVNIIHREMPERRPGNFNYIIVCTFLLGMVYFLKELTGYAFYLFKLRRSRLPAQREELALLPPRGPRLYRSTIPTTPMLVGLFRPAIYLPNMEYTEAQLQDILSHELTHWRRHDVAVKWLATLAVHLHWFNPIAYLARREIDRACELACDEAVINGLDNDGKQSYGNTLIEMVAESKKPKMIVFTTMCEEKKTLKERLGAIMHSKKPTKKVVAFSCMLLAIAFCGIVLLGASTYPKSGSDVKQAELLSAMRENVVPDGLTLEITSAAQDDAEFLVSNMTENIVEYGYANRVERYINGEWEPAISETKAIFPEDPEPLQAGERLYGMAAWVRDNTELSPGSYRYLMLVNVRDGDNIAYPVVLEALFEITE